MLKGEMKIVFVGMFVTTLAPLLLHMNVHHADMVNRELRLAGRGNNMPHIPSLKDKLMHLDPDVVRAAHHQSAKDSSTDVQGKQTKQKKTTQSGAYQKLSKVAMELSPFKTKPTNTKTQWDNVALAAKNAEQSILDFFHGEHRALQDGVPFGGTETKLSVLTERLADRIALCHGKGIANSNDGNSNCTLRVVFLGGGQASGRDIFKNQTYAYQAEPRLRALAQAAGLKLEVLNHAMDSDLSREGPQTLHQCVANFAGNSVDVLSWDSESTMQGNPSAQIEAFVRWASVLKPALIMFNRGGPHARSRRGIPRGVVNLVASHDATVYDDKPEDIPEPREDPYSNSSRFEELWANQRNLFWGDVFDRYSSYIDFAGIDPSGSIWHLDHLQEFSNGAFEEGKALPLYDCPAPGHPPPCDQVPPYVIRHLAKENKSIESLPRDDTSGAFCGVEFGCRHAWYGGTRSHALRAALNALPIVRAFQSAAKLLVARDCEDIEDPDQQHKNPNTNSHAFTMNSLPEPKYCSKKFCTLKPTCLSTYVPNIGHKLGPAILSNETFPASMPRLGACHYAHNPEFAVRNLNRRFGPLGWDDRKYAFRLAKEDPKEVEKKKKKKAKGEQVDDEDASSTAIGFVTDGPGPLVLCEPPCFIDECSPKRKRPLVKHVTLNLDGTDLQTPNGPPPETEVGGMFCRVIAKQVPAGRHMLRISTEAVAPDHVMFSHLISFV
ncbi:expressed unknown protein [Seminavis robusta]|uniref:Uncharacterized protein n=1 Tax=Seminavis robusta TaxID=568900 RepID=A0A9N8EK02_9STRA|nr:expressed unknown protein [Seminavis robusta]|eukprot:Sro1109_g242280.1 n/a (720) ;mRNA; r:13504-15734